MNDIDCIDSDACPCSACVAWREERDREPSEEDRAAAQRYANEQMALMRSLVADDCTDDADTCPCPDCVRWRDNREGPEPDGESMTSAERYAVERETQAEMQRSLK